MSFCIFVAYGQGGDLRACISAEDDAKLSTLLRRLPGLERAHVYTPAVANDPFVNDGAPPRLVLQLYFQTHAELESAAARGGALSTLSIPSLTGVPVTHEAMLVRLFPVPSAASLIARELYCTYLVAYEGPAEDPDAWHEHYIANHPPIMAKLPGLRELEIYTGVEWAGSLPGERVRHLQRNKVAFDSHEVLTAALQSPLRAEMRADYMRFPKFSGKVTHFPMATRVVRP